MEADKNYRFTRVKRTDLKEREVTYVLRLTSTMENDPGPHLSLELFREYLRHLEKKQREKLK